MVEGIISISFCHSLEKLYLGEVITFKGRQQLASLNQI